jgi:fatty-acyl-CoA synthase
MAAIQLRPDTVFDGPGLAANLLHQLPGYSVPLFVRLVNELPQTSTFKYAKRELQNSGYDTRLVDDPIYVLADRETGYVPQYHTYPEDVAAGEIRI